MTHPIDRHLVPVVGALVVAFGPHVFRMPVWLSFGVGLLWLYAIRMARGRFPRPPKLIMLAMTMAGFFGAVASFGRVIDSDTCVGLLAIMTGLKPLETRSYRDGMILVFLAYFLVLTNLFYSDELIMTLYMAFSVWATTMVLIRLHRPDGRWRKLGRLAAMLMAQALPVAAALFVLFPRVNMGIGAFNRGSGGTSGFSDRLSPGSMSQMVKDDAVAFRVLFQGEAPAPQERYWRGIVFSRFDGRTWRQGFQIPMRLTIPAGERPTRYRLTLEPHRERWLFALDLPSEAPPPAMMMSDFTLMARRSVNARLAYETTSFREYDTGRFAPYEAETRQLPSSGNPRSRQLAAGWAAEAASPKDIVAKALAFFSENEFYYSLKAPLAGSEIVDAFLFDARRGFCEHYASAFVFLMRAAGVPARIVGGYLGAERNPYGDYWIVRQSDAHAWAEVWLEGEGWVRVDPTAAVAPERIERSALEALAPDELADFLGFTATGPLKDWLRVIGLGWDSVNAYWTVFVMGYTQLDRRNLLEALGIPTGGWKEAVWLAGGVAFVLALLQLLLIVRARRPNRAADDPARKLYDRFCRKLARYSMARRPGEGPHAYARRICEALPDARNQVDDITRQYVRLRYAPDAPEGALRAFRRAVRRFSVGKG